MSRSLFVEFSMPCYIHTQNFQTNFNNAVATAHRGTGLANRLLTSRPLVYREMRTMCSGFLRPEKMHLPLSGLNPRTLDLEASTLPRDHRVFYRDHWREFGGTSNWTRKWPRLAARSIHTAYAGVVCIKLHSCPNYSTLIKYVSTCYICNTTPILQLLVPTIYYL